MTRSRGGPAAITASTAPVDGTSAPKRDDAALAGLYTRFRSPLLRYFMRRGQSEGEAEDLTQQVFMRLLASGTVGEIVHVDRFVFTVAANLLRDRHRSAAHRMEQTFQVLDPISGACPSAEAEERSPERILLGVDALSEVSRTLEQLGEKTRRIFLMHRLDKVKHRDIAELTGLSVSMVEKHVIKAKHCLSQAYGSCPV